MVDMMKTLPNLEYMNSIYLTANQYLENPTMWSKKDSYNKKLMTKRNMFFPEAQDQG